MCSPINEFRPSEGLNPYIEMFWGGSFNTNKEHLSMQMVPNGCVEVIIHLSDLHCNLHNCNYGWTQSPDYMILGLFTRPYEVKFTTTVKVFSIRFKPEGIYNVFGVPASMFTDNYKDLSLVLGKEFRDFCRKLRGATDFSEMIRMTEIYLLKSLEQQQIDITYVNYAADLIRKSQGLKIEDISSQVSISQRQLEREFKAKIGIGPKKYLRLTRINEVLRLLEKNFELTLASVAYHCGYADQAHFIKDFKTITGVKPSVFIRERERFFSLTGLSHHDS